MKIYLIKRNDEVGYDEYVGFVVAATSAREAKDLVLEVVTGQRVCKATTLVLWENLPVKYLGRAEKLAVPAAGIILSDFNAG